MTGTADRAISVTYTLTPGTATNPADFTGTTGTLTWPAMASGTQSASLTVVADSVNELAETLTFTLSSATEGASIGPQSSATVSITDNNPVSFTATATTAAEGAALADLVRVTLSGQADRPLTVTYTTVSATAQAPNDFVFRTGTLTWAIGETMPKTASIAIVDDAIAEVTENFTVMLSNPSAGTTIATGTASATITDNDVSDVSVASVVVSEGSAFATLTLVLSKPSEAVVGVTYQTGMPATATAGTDFTAAAPTIVTFAPGTTTRTIFVPLIPDAISEGDEMFTVALSLLTGSPGGTVSGPATVTITDDDFVVVSAPRAVSFVETEATVARSVRLTTPVVSTTPVTVTYTVLSAGAPAPAATAGTDFTAVPLVPAVTIVIPAGASFVDVPVSILGDALPEANENLVFTVVSVTGGSLPTVGNSAAIVTIVDNDLAQFTAPALTSVSENVAGGTVTVTVTLSASFATAVSVDYTTAPVAGTSVSGAATLGVDYLAASGTLTFPPGSVSQTFTVTISPDTVLERDEDFAVVLSNPVGGVPIGTALGVVRITNDDTVTLSANAVTFAESDGTVLAVSVTSVGSSDAPFSVSFATVSDTAIAGSDFVAAAGTLSWAALETGSTKTFSVTLLDDNVAEALEAFRVVLSGATAGVTLGPSSAVATITDNDTAVINVRAATRLESAGATNAIVLELVGVSDRPVSVDYATAPLTAVAVDDYITATGTVTWAAGTSGLRTAIVVIVDDVADPVKEPTQTFSVVASSPTTPATLGVSSASVTIMDDDSAHFVARAVTVQESAGGPAPAGLGVLGVEVVLVGKSDVAVSVTYAAIADSAVSPDDFVAASASGTLTWAAGATGSRFANIFIINDSVQEGPEQFTVTLSAPTGGATIAATIAV